MGIKHSLRTLTVLQSDIEYTQEYKRFVSGVSYADPDQTPSFMEAVEALRNLVDALRLDNKMFMPHICQSRPRRSLFRRSSSRLYSSSRATSGGTVSWTSESLGPR
jgi:hypothetical protein